MKILDRKTKEEVDFTTKEEILKNFLTPIRIKFEMIPCNTLKDMIEKYKDVPLTKYIRSKKDTRTREENIPRFRVKGYDEKVGGKVFNKNVENEFYQRFWQKMQR